MTPDMRTIRTVDLSLGAGGQTLRLTLTRDADGGPEGLVLAAGFGGGDTGQPFRRPPWGSAPLVLPASIVPALRDALDTLADTTQAKDTP